MSIKLERIREDAADAEWIEAFSAVLQEYEHPNSSAPTPSNSDIVFAFNLIHKKLAVYDQGDDTLVRVSLDTLRVLLRYREDVGETLFSKIFRALLRLCSFEGHNAAALLAARCLINILFDNPKNVELFLSVEVDGVAKVAHIMERHYAEAHLIVETEEVDCLHYHLVRVLHMMVCQSESAREALRPVDKPLPLTYSLVRALIQRLHLCVAPTRANESNNAHFPHSEAVGKLYLEIARLLYVLDWHVALHVHASAHHQPGGSNVGRVIDSNGASSVLNRLLIVTILSAIVKSSVPYTITGSTAVSATETSSVGVPPHSLCRLKDQCQDVSLQLAMVLPTECYSDHAVLTELSVLMHCAVDSAAPVMTTALEAKEQDSGDGAHDEQTAAMHIEAITRVSLHLVCVLQRQLQQAYGEYHGADSGDNNSGAMRPVEQCALLSPVLVVMTNFCANNSTAWDAVKSAVFPHAYNPLSSASDSNHAKIDPTDVPPGTLRYYLVKLMISLDSQLKRCVAEFLFMLCAEDPDEFTARTGLGNAVALLQIKGLC